MATEFSGGISASNNTPLLSKTRFIHGWQCPLRLWNAVHRSGLATPNDETQLASFAVGHRVGELAQARYPGGVLVDADYRDQVSAVEQTRGLMADPSVPAIYEAAIVHDHTLTRVDILLRQDDSWDLIEVKSSTKSDGKEQFWVDIALQYWILMGAGLNVRRAGLLLLNRDYVYPGADYDLDQLFWCSDLTTYCENSQRWVEDRVAAFHQIMGQSAPPRVEIGPHCSVPYDCPFWAHCTQGLVWPEHPIENLPNLAGRRYQGLVEQGIETIPNIPGDYPLTEKQQRVRDAIVTGEPWVSPKLTDALDAVEWPLFFLDFEAVSLALPGHPGMSPYEQLPFQFSCHIQREPGAALEHAEFLATDQEDPREPLARALVQALGDAGSILVYSSYEQRTIRNLAGWVPHLADQLLALKPRLCDLLAILRSHYYHPDFEGSYSIKSVLPVLSPEMSYTDMEVSDGTQAGRVWLDLIKDPGERDRDRNRWETALRAYCHQDSYAMYQIYTVLRRCRSSGIGIT